MSQSIKEKRIGVLMGGISSEREVSLRSGEGVHRALLEKGYDAEAIDWSEERDLAETLRSARIQVAWIALHGTHGEDGCVQGLLECMKIPYTGSGVSASAVAMDKVFSKKIFEEAQVPTPDWNVVDADEDADKIAGILGYPCVVKPSCEGSTVGVTVVNNREDLDPAIELARKCHGQVMMEAYVAGREVSCAILDGEVLGTVEIRPKSAFYDYQAKYLRGDTEYLVPAPLSEYAEKGVRLVSLHAYRALGCVAHARVDVRIDAQGTPFVLEVNTLPGMTATSLFPKIARHAGMDYAALVERILMTASLKA
ncbi:MAG: D-alanine--D-alanine ligase [Deltaproteobacteria bacterium]|nr:D-alanine--D-alanine ligase [Deltaproteobacteria bacterium]